eukprot:396189-Amphidinium_carterae.1
MSHLLLEQPVTLVRSAGAPSEQLCQARATRTCWSSWHSVFVESKGFKGHSQHHQLCVFRPNDANRRTESFADIASAEICIMFKAHTHVDNARRTQDR